MKIDADEFRVAPSERVKLASADAHPAALQVKEHYQELLERHVEDSDRCRTCSTRRTATLCWSSSSHGRRGQDGMIEHVMSGVNPQGCQVYTSSTERRELKHDFLWRCARAPRAGRIGIFNRSYYEEVLIVRVHPEILRSEGVPGGRREDDTWKSATSRSQTSSATCTATYACSSLPSRFEGEQRKRLLARIDDPQKNWKFSMADSRSPALGGLHEGLPGLPACTSKRYAPGSWYRRTTSRMHG